MSTWLRVGWSMVRAIVHIVLGVLLLALYFPRANTVRQERLVRWWSHRLLSIVGVRLKIIRRGESVQTGTMLLLNHISWIDVYVVHALRPVRFVAKSEIRNWPVIGYLCDRTGTIFIERGRRHAVHQANHTLARILKDGGLIAVFPEGTTSDGSGLLPFHANLIQAAIEAGVAVQPVALQYTDLRGRYAVEPAYVGEMTLVESIRATMQGAHLIANLTLLPRIETAGKTRHQVAAEARAAIASSLGVDIGGRQFETSADFQGELL